ncbi:MAG: hypothetical protein K2O85_07990, partial [Helicobacter sp.]|nr:hypothetical protein [Helicobacter sp.]
THTNHLSSYRLRLSNVIPSDTERVLYLDSDMLALADVRELFGIHLGEHIAAVVPDCAIPNRNFFPKTKKLPKISLNGHTYFNSGVVLLNYPRYIEENIEEQCLDIIHNYQTHCPDQDALNIVLMGKILYLNFAWNCTLHLRYDKDDSQIARSDYENAKQSPNIVHYSRYKPWHSHYFYTNTIGQPIVAQQRELWWEAAAQTPVYADILQHNNSFDVEALDRLNSFAHALNLLQLRIDRLRAPSRALSQLWKKLRFWK